MWMAAFTERFSAMADGVLVVSPVRKTTSFAND
jgi:hypothetical protein